MKNLREYLKENLKRAEENGHMLEAKKLDFGLKIAETSSAEIYEGVEDFFKSNGFSNVRFDDWKGDGRGYLFSNNRRSHFNVSITIIAKEAYVIIGIDSII